jgi:hypothetical protein
VTTGASVEGEVRSPASARLLRQAASALEAVYSSERALFPFSTGVRGREYVNNYGPPKTLRYTINSLLGLREAAHATGSSETAEVNSLVDAFLERQYGNITSYADLGLLLVLLRDRPDGDHARDARRRIEEVVASDAARNLDMQSLSWMLWGLSAAAHGGAPTRARAAELFRLIVRDFVHPGSLLPRHSVRLYRRGLVCFGVIVYFLRALHEYASLTDDPEAEALFRNGVERMLDVQGRRGEWPWLFSVRSGCPIELYPVYAVHQDSMALLFLLPALDAGLPSVREAIERSFAWVLGENELHQPMYAEDPFRAYRSIERTDPLPRATRYARALANDALGRTPAHADAGRVRVNPQCRSYHLGWILYVWSGRSAMLEQVAGGAGARVASAREPALAPVENG